MATQLVNFKVIRNGSKFPVALKTATVRNSTLAGTKDALNQKITVRRVAAEHGVAYSTLVGWRAEAGVQNKLSKKQAAHFRKKAEKKLFNTPVPCDAKGQQVEADVATHVKFHGKVTAI